MNWKILAAFTAGALVASGIVYMAVKDAPVAAAPAASVEIARPAEVPAPPAPVVPVAPHIRQKPSPMPPPVRRERPVTVARLQTPPVRLEPIAEAPPDPKPPVEAEIPREPAQAAPPEEPPPRQPQEPGPRVPNTVTITAGTLLQVRIGETISAAHYQVGDVFLATLDRPLVVEGFIIAERGSRLEGRVVEAQPAGRGSAASRLGIELVKLSTSDGQRILIRTHAYRRDAGNSAGGGVAKVGVTAEIPVESRINFRIENPITITERLN
jgi:hypothetical protein